MGVRPEEAVKALRELDVVAIGVNCGNTLEENLMAVTEMRTAAPDVTLIAKPNAGLPRMEDTVEVVYDVTPEIMAEYALKFGTQHIKMLGGCCGSTPDHIAAVKEVLEDQLVIIAPSGHPLAHKNTLESADLAGQLLIMHEKGSAPRKAIEDYIRKHRLSVNIPLELSSNRAIKRAVEDGIGIALVSRKVANEEIRAGRLAGIPLSDPSMIRKFYMVHHKDKYLSESLHKFIDNSFKWAAEYTLGLTSDLET